MSVPIRTNEDLRPSRLLKSIAMYVRASALTIVRSFVAYRPFHFFGFTGVVSLGLGALLGSRFLYFYFTGTGAAGHVQSLILTAILMITGFLLLVVALLSDLISVNRKLLEKIDDRLAVLESKANQREE